MNLVEGLSGAGDGGAGQSALYFARDALAALHRRCRPLRRTLTATSSWLRRMLGWETMFVEVDLCATVIVTYAIDAAQGSVGVSVRWENVPASGITEVVVMNELGASVFDHYTDSSGSDLRGDSIGTWDEVCATEAAFTSANDGVTFTLEQVEGTRLYRGRELIGSRLAWAGFGYALPPAQERLDYSVRIAGPA